MSNDLQSTRKFISLSEIIESAKSIDTNNISEVAKFVWRLLGNVVFDHITMDKQIFLTHFEGVTEDGYHIRHSCDKYCHMLIIRNIDLHLEYKDVDSDDEYGPYQILKLNGSYFNFLFDTSDVLTMPKKVTMELIDDGCTDGFVTVNLYE